MIKQQKEIKKQCSQHEIKNEIQQQTVGQLLIDSNYLTSDNVQTKMQNEAQRIDQILTHLISKNKISSKNAFQVPVLNVNDLSYNDNQDDGTWSKISSTLENGSKVYGYRVDSMTETMQKIVNLMARTQTFEKSSNLKQQIPEQSLRQWISYQDQNKQQYLKIIHFNLDQQRIKHDSKIQMHDKNLFKDMKIRQLLDQNGISKLILATLPLGNNLQIAISNSSQKAKNIKNIKYQYQLPIMTNEINIIKQIQKIGYTHLNFLASIQDDQTQQDYNKISNMHNSQYINIGLPSTKHQIKYQERNFQASQHQFEDQQNLCISYSRINDLWLKNNSKLMSKNKHHPQPKNIKIMRQLNKRRYKTVTPCEFIDFQCPWVNLLKENIFFKKPQDNSVVQRSIYDSTNNIYDTKFYAYAVRQKSFLNQKYQNLILQAKLQEVKSQVCTNHSKQINDMLKQQVDMDLGFIDYDEKQLSQMSSKCIHIRENKQEIARILDLVENSIKFSQIYRIHKQFNQSAAQAVDFISVLHLGNQLKLTFTQINSYDFLVNK